MRFLLFVFIIMLGACAKDPDILFCEGTKPDGSTVNCGQYFSVGQLMAVYKRSKYPTAEKFDFTVYEVSGAKKERIDLITSSVKAGSKIVTADLSLHNIGTYEIEVSMNGNVVAKNNVNIEEDWLP
ncbi:MAG: hypothetical protein FWG92_06760 [Leptospirales bacterium]|nr:hypothetical protein [Leptospirales bacterium]